MAKIFKILFLFLFLILISSSAFADANNYDLAVKSINHFALRAAKLINIKNSFFLSPYSIVTALGMTYAGSDGETAKEFQDNLLFNNNMHGELGALSAALTQDFNGKNNRPLLTCANKIWLNKNLKLNKNFNNILEQAYHSTAKTFDFALEPEQAKNFINRWTAENTNQRVKDLLNKITPDTQMILTNAIYFNGKWAREFDEKLTVKKPFYVNSSETLDVDMMMRQGRMSYCENERIKVLRLPYSGRLSMILMMPININDDISAVIAELNLNNFNELINSLSEYNVDLWLPRFKTERRYELKDILMRLGVKAAFDNNADFSGMIDNKDLKLKIDAVIHKTFIEVNEKRTEAAAASAVVMTRATSARPRPVPKAEFHADRPFVYFIVFNASDDFNAILFMGMQNFK